MSSIKFKAWVHPRQKLSMVFNRSLDGWIIQKHRKDGRISSRFMSCYGPGFSRDEAIQRIRKSDQGPVPVSGWKRANLTRGSWQTWADVHQAAWLLALNCTHAEAGSDLN